MACAGCGRMLRVDNKAGYCTKTAECRKAHGRVKSQQRQREGYPQRWKIANPDSQMLASARIRAAKAGVPCTISRNDIQAVWRETCPIFGYELSGNHDGTGTHSRTSLTLDRIDPSRGYVPGNIQILSHRANSMKSDATPEELLQFAAWIQATYGAAQGGD